MFNQGQANLYDTSLTTAVPFVKIRLAAADVYLTTTSAPNHPLSLGSPAPSGAALATPCILRWGQTSTGFNILGEDDQVSSMIVTAQNVRLAINTQSSSLPWLTFRGFLSEYLQSMTLQGPAGALYDYPPGLVSVYMTAYPGQFDQEFIRHYLFRGLLYDFEVSGDNNIVTMRFIEDTRWNREHPYPLSRKTYFALPQESAGLHQPLIYGNFALWAHKDFPKDLSTLKGPFDPNGPWFPVCANLASSILTMPQFLQTGGSGARYTLGLSDSQTHGLAGTQLYSQTNGEQFQCLVFAGDNMAARVTHEPSFGDGASFGCSTLDGGAFFPISHTGMRDLTFNSWSLLGKKHYANAMLIPARQVDSTRQATTNLSTFFNGPHRDRSAPHIIDGDRYSWFKDDVSSTSTREICYELGAYSNAGTISSVKAVLIGRRRVGSGSITWNAFLDYFAAAVGPDDGILDGGGTTVSTFATGGYFCSVLDLSDVLTHATRVHNWEFTQLDAAASGGNAPMKIALKWNKGTAGDTFDIIGFGLLVKFNPSRDFQRYEEQEYEASGGRAGEYDAAGRKKSKATTITQTRIVKIYTDRPYTANRQAYYAGLGYMADAPLGFPGDKPYFDAPATLPNIIQNPAEILRHLIYYQGGGTHDDNSPGWPLISLSEFEYGSSNGRSFSRAEDNLDTLLRDSAAPGNSSESFKMAVAIPQWPDVRTAAMAVMQSIPGLKLYRVPVASNQDASVTHRGAICCSFPLVGETPTYRRKISLRADCVSFTWGLLPHTTVINDLRMKYGYSVAKGNYCRELWVNNNIFEHGWPFNSRNSGSLESDASDPLSTVMGQVLEESFQRYGLRKSQLELPWIYRWHEALAIRNWIIRWRAFQRVRLELVGKIGISDLLPGDVFQLADDTDEFMQGHRFPLLHLPDAPVDWDNTTWLVERVTYEIGEGGELIARIQAIWNGQMGES